MSTTLRDALQIQRLNTMRRRSAAAQANAKRIDGTCDCPACQMRKQLSELLSRAAVADAEDSPANADAIAPSRAH